MDKYKIMAVVGLMFLTLSLISGVTYAWYVTQSEEEAFTVNSGRLRIELDSSAVGEEILLHPGDGHSTVYYKLYNPSERTVFAVFIPGQLRVYKIPDEYMDGDCVDKEYREELNALDDSEKLDHFIEQDPYDEEAIVYGTGGMGAADWSLAPGSEYLDKGENNEVFFELLPGGWAKCKFTIGLKPEAGNEYQYALLKLGSAEAYGTQNLDEAKIALKQQIK